jgi:predicted lysophospholipase L1 biosynthesis ABC-type transport system permease subunit
MPIALILAGIILAVISFRGTEHDTAKLLAADFGQGSKFWAWGAAIAVLGALGYAAPLRGFSTALLTLLIVAMVLTHGGLFDQLKQVIINPPAPAPAHSLTEYASVIFGSKVSGEVSADLSGPIVGGGGVTGAVGGTDPVPVTVIA